MKTYRIEELETTGWVMVEDHQHLPKEKASEILNELISQGYNPNSLRAIPDGTVESST